MDANEAFLTLLRDSHSMVNTAMADVPRDLLWRQPPGTVNPIGAIYCHAVGVEDMYVQQVIQGKATVWEAGGWAAKLGRASPPNEWGAGDAGSIGLEAFLPYRRAVYSASELFIASLGPADFERRVQFPGRDWSMTVAQLLTLVVSHGTAHAGEIAALKGVFGGKGLPY
jgi:hypothetical protein